MSEIKAFTTLPESRGGASGKGRKGNPNRYAYRLGTVQKLILGVVQKPNLWCLVRESASNRSSLAPTLGKYSQFRFATRKREDDGLYDIYVRYTPNEFGQPDEKLAADIQEWKDRLARSAGMS
jgi:hypothetical protein